MNRMNRTATYVFFVLPTDSTNFTNFYFTYSASLIAASVRILVCLDDSLLISCPSCHPLATILNMFSACKITIFFLPRADMPNLPAPHHVRCA